MGIDDIEKLINSKFEEVTRRFDEQDRTLEKLDSKMDSTCNRLTIQETQYQAHIEQEKKERESQDHTIDRKYALWSAISSIGLFVLGIFEFKRGF